jgi:hypothetical protein
MLISGLSRNKEIFMKKIFLVLLLCSFSAAASALVTRATYMKKNSFRDSQPICFKPVDLGQGNPIAAFDVTITVCPQIDPTQIENPDNLPCQTVGVQNYAATAAQKNWVKAAWTAANTQLSVPETAADAP